MAYLKSWGEIQAWMQDNGIQRWNISRTEKQDNNNVFVYDTEKSLDENKLICERALERFTGDVMYIVGWRSTNAKVGGFSAMILYERGASAAPTATMQPQVGGLYGVGSQVDIAGLTADIEQRISNRYEKERLERLEKDLREEKRDLEAQKNSAMGILAQYLAPVAQQLAGRIAPLQKMAGIDATEPVEVEPIRVKRRPADTAEPDTEAEPQEEEIEVFCTEDEYNQMLALMERFAKVEPQWLALLEAVTNMAESGDGTYSMAKQFLLK